MTLQEFEGISWNRGNIVKLSNGNEYKVIKVAKAYLLLYTPEYKKHFVADYRIIDCRISDAIEETPKKKQKEIVDGNSKVDATVKEAPIPMPIVEAAPTPEPPVRKKRPRIVRKSIVERVSRV